MRIAGKKPCELIKNLKQFNIVEKFEYKAPNTYCICSKKLVRLLKLVSPIHISKRLPSQSLILLVSLSQLSKNFFKSLINRDLS